MYTINRLLKQRIDLIIGVHQRETTLSLTERKIGYSIIQILPNGKLLLSSHCI